MHRILWALLGGVAVLTMADDAAAQRRRGNRGSSLAEQYCWMSDYQKAKRVAQKSGEPMMIVFRCVP